MSAKVGHASSTVATANIGHKGCRVTNNIRRPIPKRGMIKLKIAAYVLHYLTNVVKMAHDS